MLPPLITLEEHFLANAATNRTVAVYSEQFKYVPNLEAKLRSLGELRLKDMDAGNVSVQVISHGPIPGGPTVNDSIAINDQLYQAVSNERRFVGFATLAMSEPQEAAKELRRAVNDLGFVGALIDNHIDGRYYDGDEYLVFWKAAEELGVPIYLHPAWPSADMLPQYTGNFAAGATTSISTSAFGWHSQTHVHVLRLYASKLFDKCPRLKLVVGHFGEMLPFMLEREATLSKRWGNFDRDFKTVYEQNLWITTSGVWSLAPLATMLINTPIDHILYSVDYPFASNEAGLSWISQLEKSGMVTPEQLKKIAYQNAEDLLGIKVEGDDEC